MRPRSRRRLGNAWPSPVSRATILGIYFHHMNTKTILGVFVTVVVLGGGYYFYTSSDQYAAKYGRVESIEKGPSGERIVRRTAPEREPEGQITPMQEGWSQYTNVEWGLTFAYPSSWQLTEEDSDIVTKDGAFFYGGELESIKITGEGYDVHFNNIGRGYPTGLSTTVTERVVGGKKERVFEDKFGETFWQAMGACNVALEISRPTESKQITDKIITSVKCSTE